MELRVEAFKATKFIHTDSQTVIVAISDREYRPKSYHMDPKIHLLRNRVLKGELKMIHIRSEANSAFIQTKAVNGPTMMRLRPDTLRGEGAA